jgi:Domain of unknown function (DUF5671)
MNTGLVDFTRNALSAGVARGEVARVLREAGWQDSDIAAALDSFAEVAFPIPVPKPKPYVSAWEVFIYLVLFAALYTSAYSLAAMIFDLINLAFPDPLQSQLPRSIFYDGIRWDIASLVIALPLFLFMFTLVNREIARDPNKRSSMPRKWLTYLTLFFAVICLVGDLTTLVYNVLGGEFTTRFALKVLTVALIAGGIFAYFLIDVRQDEAR